MGEIVGQRRVEAEREVKYSGDTFDLFNLFRVYIIPLNKG